MFIVDQTLMLPMITSEMENITKVHEEKDIPLWKYRDDVYNQFSTTRKPGTTFVLHHQRLRLSGL